MTRAFGCPCPIPVWCQLSLTRALLAHVRVDEDHPPRRAIECRLRVVGCCGVWHPLSGGFRASRPSSAVAFTTAGSCYDGGTANHWPVPRSTCALAGRGCAIVTRHLLRVATALLGGIGVAFLGSGQAAPREVGTLHLLKSCPPEIQDLLHEAVERDHSTLAQ